MSRYGRAGAVGAAVLMAGAVAFGAMNFLREQGTVDYTNPGAAIKSGAIIDLGDRYGVALADIASNVTGTVKTDGVWSMTLATNQTVAFGDRLYFDSSKTNLTTTSTAAKHFGVAVKAVTTTTATGIVEVELNAPINNVVVGVDVQAYDADLTSVAAMSGIMTTNIGLLNSGGTTSTFNWVIDPQ